MSFQSAEPRGSCELAANSFTFPVASLWNAVGQAISVHSLHVSIFLSATIGQTTKATPRPSPSHSLSSRAPWTLSASQGTPLTQSNSENLQQSYTCFHSQVFNFTERLIASHEYGNLNGAGRILPHGWKTGQELPDRIFPRARARQGKSVWFRDYAVSGPPVHHSVHTVAH